MKTWLTISVLDTFEAADSYRRDMLEAHGKHGSDISAYVKVKRTAKGFEVKIGRDNDVTRDPSGLVYIGSDIADFGGNLSLRNGLDVLRWCLTARDPDDLGSSGDPPDWHTNPSGEE
jgi:hypothetical protein